MAATEAVETVIGDHYNDQLRDLEFMEGDDIDQFKEFVKLFRDEELEHLKLSTVDNISDMGLHVFKQVVQTGCKAAIQVAKVI